MALHWQAVGHLVQTQPVTANSDPLLRRKLHHLHQCKTDILNPGDAELAACLPSAYLFCRFIIHFECPEVEPSRELTDGGEREEELLCAAQWRLGVGQLSLLDLLLLFFSGDHG